MKKHTIPSRTAARLTTSTLLAYAAFHGLSFAQMVTGEVIGVSFAGRNGGSTLTPTQSTGVVAQENWNVISYPGGGTNGYQVLTNTGLAYDIGNGTSTGTSAVSISAQANDSWYSNVGTGNAMNTLMNGVLKSNSDQPLTTVSFSGLASGIYKTIVYTMQDNQGGEYSLSLGGTTYYGQCQTGNTNGSNPATYTNSFVQNTNTTAGVYPLANYVQFNSTLADTGTLSLAYNYVGIAPGGNANGVGIAGIQVQLVALNDTWSGVGNTGAWDTATANWTGQNSVYANGDQVTFADTDANSNAVTAYTVNIQGGGVTPYGVSVNTANTYTFTGGAIGGTGALTKAGNGTLVLNNTNTFSGGTTINGGTIQLGVNNALLSTGALTVSANGTFDLHGHNQTLGSFSNNGTVTNAAASTTSTLTVPSGSSPLINYSTGAYSGTIADGAGAVAVAKTTNGTLNLAGTNTYSGGTTISSTGTVNVGSNTALGSGTVTVSGAATINFVAQGGLYEGLLSGSFNTSDPNPKNYVRNTTVLAGSNSLANFPSGIQNNSTVVYTGYINNPSSSPATWTFAENFDDSVLLTVNGATVLNDGGWNNPTQNSVTLKPGLNAFELRLGQGVGGVGPVGGSVAGNYGVAVDTTGNDPTNAANYTALPVDTGNGAAFAVSYANNVSNPITINANNATLNVGFNAPGGVNVGPLTVGGYQLNIKATGATTYPILTAAGTTLTGNATFNVVGATTNFAPGALNDGGASWIVSKGGPGTLVLNQPAVSPTVSVVVNNGTAAVGGTTLVPGISASPFGNSLTLNNANTVLQLTGEGAGLLGSFYNNGPSTASYTSLATLNAHLATLTPALVTPSNTGGNTGFNFSNNGYGNNAPFNTAGSTQAAFGFSSTANYEVEWNGYINVTTPGTATFASTSDDGSMVYVNGTTVVNNNAFQGATTQTGTYNFPTAGLYPISLAFYQGGGGQGVLFQWNQAGGTLHTLTNNEVVGGGYSTLQSYSGTTVAIEADTTQIQISNSLNASIGAITIGQNSGVGHSFTIASPDTTASAYSLTAGSTTFYASPNTVTVANSTGGGTGTFKPGALNDLGSPVTVNKAGPGTILLDTPATSFTAGSTLNVTQGTLVVGGSNSALNPMGSGNIVLSGGSLSLAATSNYGLLGSFYSNGPTQSDYATLTSLNAHLGTLTPQVVALSTTGGKTSFDFSGNNYINGDIFGATNSATTAAYGFTTSGNNYMEVKWTGYIDVTQAGVASFASTSDDGTMVYIDGNVVVANNYNQGATTRTGTVNLTAGYHLITLAFNQGNGGLGALFQWNQAGGTLHTLLNTEVGQDTHLNYQNYSNNVTVTADANIDVSNSLNATIGALTVGSHILSLTSADTTGNPYILTAASTSLGGAATFSVAPSAGSGAATFSPGAIAESVLGSGFTKTGNGTLLLTQPSTYTGATNINAGTVIVSNMSGSATGAGPVTVQGTGKLTGAGAVAGSLAISSISLPGGTFAPGSGVGTALAIGGSVTILGGATLNYDLAAPGMNETANITGSLSLTGSETVNINELSGFALGNYVLATATGGVSIGGATFTINQTGPGNLPGITPGLIVSGNQLILGFTNQSIVWTGGTDGNWNNTTTGNWTVVSSFLDGDTVTFADGASNTAPVTIAGVVQPYGVNFTNTSATSYTINGTIGGPGGLTKTGNGTVTLTGTNTYTGATVLTGGTLVITTDSNLGAVPATATPGQLVINGATLAFTGSATISANRGIALGSSVGTIDVSGSNAVEYAGVIGNMPSQVGVLTKTDNGTLILDGQSTYSGATNVNGGTLQLTLAGNTGGSLAGGGPINIAGGATLLAAATDALGYFNHTSTNVVNIAEGGLLTVTGGSRLSMDRTINDVGGTVGSQGVGDGTGSSYTLRDTYNSNNIGVHYNFTSAGDGTPSTFSAIGIGLAGPTTFNVTPGGGPVDLNVTGNIVDNFILGSSLTLTGGGTTVFTGTNTYSGATTLSAGTLQLGNGGNYGQTGSGTITNNGSLIVNRSGTLVIGASINGSGTLSNVGTSNTVLSGASSFSGGTTIASGTVTAMGSATALGTGNVVMTGGVLSLGGVGVSNFSNFTLNGGASLSNGVLMLTDGNNTEARSAFYNTPQDISSGFTASFLYTAAGNRAADGITFTIQNNSPTALGASGGALGYGGILNSGAIALNIYAAATNGGAGTQFVTGGTSPEGPTYYSVGSISLGSGDPIRITLSYNSTTNTLMEALLDTVNGSTFSKTYNSVNFQTLLGGTTGYVGFTGGSGGLNAVQTVSGFSFVNQAGTFNNHLVVGSGAVAGLNVLPIGSGGVGSATLSGAVTIGAGSTVNVTGGTVATDSDYELTLGNTTLAGNATVDIAHNGLGNGTLTVNGTLNLQGNKLTVTDSGTVNINGASLSDGTLDFEGATTTNVNAALGVGGSDVYANATVNFTASQTLDSLNIGFSAPLAGVNASPIVAAVPEPGSLSLLVVGALGMLRRRKRG